MRRINNFFLCMIVLLFLSSCSLSKNPNLLNLFFFDVGQGDSSLINYNGISILIDTGDEKFVNNSINIMKSQNIKTLDYVILSHDHADHVSGFKDIYNSFNIKNLILPGVLKDETFNSIKHLLKNSNTKITYIDDPKTLKIFNNFKLEFISPLKNVKEFNDSSLVVKATLNDFDILYTGDIEEDGQDALLKYNIQSEILKVPHHGAYNNDNNNLPNFINKVNPLISIISVGDNSYGHPDKNTLNLLNNIKTKILRTDELGTIHIICDFENNSISINTLI